MGPSGRIGYILHILDCLGQDMQVLYLGRAPRTKETLPDFLKWRRVTRPPLVFRRLTGSQRTPGFGVSQTSSYNSLPDELFQTALLDKLLLFTWTSSYNSLPDELFQTALLDELLLFTWTSSYNSLPDELFPTALPDELLQ